MAGLEVSPGPQCMEVAHVNLMITSLPLPVQASQSREPPSSTPPTSDTSSPLQSVILKRLLTQPYEDLRTLDLKTLYSDPIRVTDDVVQGIISVAPRIRDLNLYHCTKLTDRAVDSICKLGKHLHHLQLGRAREITDASITALALSCPRLRWLDLEECLELTDVSVCALANLSKLHRLGLVRVPNLTDEAVYTLAERCGTLRRVYLSYCVMVSVRAVHVLLQRLPKLECLALSGVPAFRSWGLRKLSRELPPYYNKLGRERSCVYTKDCIEQLRQHLTGLFNGVAWVLYGVHEHGRQSDDEELSISSDLDDECDIEDADTIDNPTTSECAESTPLLGSRFVSVSQHAPPSMGEHTAACGLTALCLHVSSATDEKGGPEKRSSWRAISRAAHKSSDGLRGLVCIFKS